jgi:hypothetical protein
MDTDKHGFNSPEPDGRLVRRPLLKPVRRNQAALRQLLPERRRGNRLRLGVDERLLAPRRFESRRMAA